MTPAEREQLLARVSDILRRSGTEDAERLIRELEKELGGPVFTRAGDLVLHFAGVIPVGRVRTDRPILQFFRPEHSVSFITPGIFPFPFQCREAHVYLDPELEPLAPSLYFAENHNGNEVARFPVGSFSGAHAVEFPRLYGQNESRAMALWAARPFSILRTPKRIDLMLAGSRMSP